jgi:hypothetical protein
MKVRTVLDARRFSPEKMQKVSLFATPRLFCDLYCLEPNQSQKTHSHEGSDKVYVVLEGRGSFQVGEENEEIGPGQGSERERRASGAPGLHGPAAIPCLISPANRARESRRDYGRVWVRYVIPTVIVVIFVYGWWDRLKNLLDKIFG